MLKTILSATKEFYRFNQGSSPRFFSSLHRDVLFTEGQIQLSDANIYAADPDGTPRILCFDSLIPSQLCQQVLDYVGTQGFQKSTVNLSGKEGGAGVVSNNFRKNSRYNFQSLPFSTFPEANKKSYFEQGPTYSLFKLIRPILQSISNFRGAPLVGFNPEAKVYNNAPGDFFKRHPDGVIDLNNYVSIYSLILYLTDRYQGGELYFPGHKLSLKPEIGSIVLFRNPIVHEGKPVISGEKTQFRTDIFYDLQNHPELDQELRNEEDGKFKWFRR